MRDPRDIYQENLDRVAVRLWARDFDGVCDLLLVPPPVGTGAGVEDGGAIRRNLADYCRSLDEFGAQGYHRLCLEAAYTSDEGVQIRGRHRTFVLAGGAHVIPPYDCEMDLLMTPHGWKAARLRLLADSVAIPIIDPAEFRPRENATESLP
ncbi:hypothetical protein [Jannaschia formosa]|uniref:hypothetical protein n=1 Tax=Jannaschia formosa TaxID=2259592 RepID=UPI000E1BAFF4|nr:hypothetical protein [Jannaschia formosa]TFL16984.1 hypothetical protein DR046_17085 [Jannaschia formosa]